jgi:hypothetical protein
VGYEQAQKYNFLIFSADGKKITLVEKTEKVIK